MKFLGINIVLMPNSVKILYNYAIEFSKYADRINGCSGILKFGINPDQGKLVLKQAFFCRVRHCPVCQWRRSLLWGRLCFSNCQIFRNASYPSLGIFNAYCKNPPVTELRDTLKHMNDSWQRLIQTKRFKSGVAGFLRTTEVTRGNDADMMAHPHFHALLLVKPSYFRGQGYIKQGDWVEMWAKALRADYLPSVNVKAVKATLDEKGRKQLDKAICETLKYSVKPLIWL